MKFSCAKISLILLAVLTSAAVSIAADKPTVYNAGTDKELWDTYAPTFDKMGAFKLIDMKRFKK